MHMKNKKTSQKEVVINILARSFSTNQSVNYIIKQDRHQASGIRSLMDYSYEMCTLFGDVFIAENESACGLVLYPDKKIHSNPFC